MRHQRHFGVLLLAVWLVAAVSLKAASAATVIITITGTVSGGEDQFGYFIPPRTLFAGQSFLLTYTFDDTKGQQGNNGRGGPPDESFITSTPSSNPGIAVLTIGSTSFAWGELPTNYINSSVLKFVPPYSSGNFQVDVTEGYNIELGSNSRSVGSSAVQMSIYPATSSILNNDVNWEASFSNSDLLTSAWGRFGIERSVTPGSSQIIAVNGYLYPQSITVSGPDACGDSSAHTSALVSNYVRLNEATTQQTCAPNNFLVSNSFNPQTWKLLHAIGDSGDGVFTFDAGEQIALVSSSDAIPPTLQFRFTAFAYPLNEDGSPEDVLENPKWFEPVEYPTIVGSFVKGEFVLQATFPSASQKQRWTITIPSQEDTHSNYSFYSLFIYVPNP